MAARPGILALPEELGLHEVEKINTGQSQGAVINIVVCGRERYIYIVLRVDPFAFTFFRFVVCTHLQYKYLPHVLIARRCNIWTISSRRSYTATVDYVTPVDH
jgi:hypothetical protein